MNVRMQLWLYQERPKYHLFRPVEKGIRWKWSLFPLVDCDIGFHPHLVQCLMGSTQADLPDFTPVWSDSGAGRSGVFLAGEISY
jgi:hypothetical protein